MLSLTPRIIRYVLKALADVYTEETGAVSRYKYAATCYEVLKRYITGDNRGIVFLNYL